MHADERPARRRALIVAQTFVRGLPQRPHRRRGLPGLRRRRGPGRLPDGRDRRRGADRGDRGDDTPRRSTRRSFRTVTRVLGCTDHADGTCDPISAPRSSCWRSSAQPTASRTSRCSRSSSGSSPIDMLTRVLGLVWGLAMGGVADRLDRRAGRSSRAIGAAAGVRRRRARFLPLLDAARLPTARRDRQTVAPGAELELIDRVPMFAPLSIATKEQVAASLRPDVVSAGRGRHSAQAIAGDRFYIVATVSSTSMPAAAMRPRTKPTISARSHSCATCRGRRRSRLRSTPNLYALQRDDFLAAVTGHSAAHAAGEAVAEERLAAFPTSRGNDSLSRPD